MNPSRHLSAVTTSLREGKGMFMRTAVVATAVCVSAIGMSVAAQVDASIRKTVSIPAQGLKVALQELAKQRHFHLVFVSEDVNRHQTGGATGELTVDEALQQILRGTGLTYQYIDDETLGILPIAAAASAGAATASRPLPAADRNAAPRRSRINWLRLAQADTVQKDPPAAVAQSNAIGKSAPVLEEIIVTAEKRAESIQRMPIAISAFSGESISDSGIADVEYLRQLAPSVQAGMKEGGYTRISIRGIGSDLGAIADEPTVALSQDGVPYSSLHLFSLDLFDVERVEVLRGPQGTISGRNATAGAINIISKRPTETFEGGLKATLGSYDRTAIEGHLSGPLVADRLLGRLAVRSDQDSGWITETAHGQSLGTTDKVQLRASLLARISDDLEANLIIDHLRDQSDYLFGVEGGRARPDVPSLVERFGIPGFDYDARTVEHDALTDSTIEKSQATLRLSWDMSPSTRLVATTGYVDFDMAALLDNDGTAAPLLVFHPSNPYGVGVWQMSQEVTLTADLTDRFDAIFGALYMKNGSRSGGTLGLPLSGIPLDGRTVFALRQNLTSWGGYTQLRYRLTDAVRVSAGVRYTNDEKSYNDATMILGGRRAVRAEYDWSAVTPRVAVDYTPTEDLTFYGSVSRGFKSGGFASFAVPANPFDPEYVWNYETGVKTNWLDQRLRIAVTGFFMDYTDLQQSVYGLDEVSVIARVVNAASATIKGVELEIDAQVSDRFKLAASGTWLDAKYDDLRSADSLYPELGTLGPAGVNVRDASGNQLIRAPEWQFNIGGEYTVPLGKFGEGTLRASYSWQDDVYYTFFNDPLASQDAYGLLNLSAAIETSDARWRLSAYVSNAQDEFYFTQKNSTVSAGAPTSAAKVGNPRVYGVSLAHSF